MPEHERSASSRHPRYRGPVIDAHAHFDACARPCAHALLAREGLSVINFWDISWPPPSFAAWRSTWEAEVAAGMSLLHTPDLSRVGEPCFERDLVEGIHEATRLGAVGIKVWKNLGLTLRDSCGDRLSVDDVRLDALWRTAAAVGLPVAIHVADPAAFFEPITPANELFEVLRVEPRYWLGDRARYPAREEIFEEFEHVVANHPATTFVGLHFGCFMPLEDVRRMLARYPNYHLDTAARTFDLARPSWRDAVLSVFSEWPERLIFGTDVIRTAAWDLPAAVGSRSDLAALYQHHWRVFETTDEDITPPYAFQSPSALTGLGLDLPRLRLLYHDNARRVYRGSGAPSEDGRGHVAANLEKSSKER